MYLIHWPRGALFSVLRQLNSKKVKSLLAALLIKHTDAIASLHIRLDCSSLPTGDYCLHLVSHTPVCWTLEYQFFTLSCSCKSLETFVPLYLWLPSQLGKNVCSSRSMLLFTWIEQMSAVIDPISTTSFNVNIKSNFLVPIVSHLKYISVGRSRNRVQLGNLVYQPSFFFPKRKI